MAASVAFPLLPIMSSHYDDYIVSSHPDHDEEEDNSNLESKMLASVKAAKNAAAKKQKGKNGAPTQKKKLNAKTSAMWCHHTHSLVFDSNMLLLLAKAFMAVSHNAKQSTNKKADKFWEEISQQFEKLIAVEWEETECESIETIRGIYSLCNC